MEKRSHLASCLVVRAWEIFCWNNLDSWELWTTQLFFSMSSTINRFYLKVCSSSFRHTLSEGKSRRKTGISVTDFLWDYIGYFFIVSHSMCKSCEFPTRLKNNPIWQTFSLHKTNVSLFELSVALSRRNNLLKRWEASIFILRSLACWNQVFRFQYWNINMQWNKCSHTFILFLLTSLFTLNN